MTSQPSSWRAGRRPEMTEALESMDYDKFIGSLQRLQEQHHHLSRDSADLSEWIIDAAKESVIQRFEVCFDTSWKTLRRHLTVVMGLASLPNSPVPVLRIASENHLLGREIEDWIAYNEARIDTSHDYNCEKAEACLEIVPRFIQDAVLLYERMTGESWQAPTL